VRDHRHGRGHPAAGGRRRRRADRPAAHAGLARGPGGPNATKVIIPDSAHGTNPASVTLGGYEVVTVPSDERGCVDMAALAGARRGRGRHHADQSQHPRPVRGGHRRHRRRRPRGGRAALLRRRQPQRHPGRGPPRRHGLRHRPHEPAQDLRHPPRRGRARGRPGGRVRAPGALPARPPGGAGGVRRPGPGLRVGHAGAQSIGRMHTWHGNALVLARALAYILANGGDGLRRSPRRPCSTPTGSASG
jgi:glycine dehydrogenase subunit 2